jgi:TPR repeat protein
MYIEDLNCQSSQLRDIGDLSVPDVVGELQIALHAGAGVLIVAGETGTELSESLEELVIEASRQLPDLTCVLFTPEHQDGAIAALEEGLRALLDRQPEETLESPPWEIVEASLLRGHLPDSSPRLLVVDRFRELFQASEADVSRFCRSLSRCARHERMAVVVGVVREDLHKLRAIAGLLPSLQPAILPAPGPGDVLDESPIEEPTVLPALAPAPELILEPMQVWAPEAESELESTTNLDEETASSFTLREIEPLPEAFFESGVLRTWDAEPVRRTAQKTGRKRSVHVFELLLVSTAVALLIYFLPLREKVISAPVASPARAEVSSVPVETTTPQETGSRPSASLIPVSGLPKQAPSAKSQETRPSVQPIHHVPPPQAPVAAPKAAQAAVEPVQTKPSRDLTTPPSPPKALAAPMTQPSKTPPPPGPAVPAPIAKKPAAAPVKPAPTERFTPKPPLEQANVDPVRRLTTELKKSPPETFGDVAVLAEKVSQSEPASSREELQTFLATRFFSEEHFPLAMGRLYTDARVNDAPAANLWFQKAADLDLAGGMTQLGISHLLGRGLPQDTEEGYRWLVRARAKNDGAGAFLAAICRMCGTGATQNLPMARELLNVAIDLQCVEAYWESSWMHEEGLGGSTDTDWAFHLCRLGASHGESKCLERLARHYETGDLVPKDLAKAAELKTSATPGGSSWLREVASRVQNLPMDHPAPAPTAETISAIPLAWLHSWYRRTQTSVMSSLASWHTIDR